MTWTTPASGLAIPADNEKILYDLASGVAAGCGYSTGSGFTYNTTAQEFTNADRVAMDVAQLDDNGTPQMRIVITCQISAVGACTSFTPKAQVYVEAATGSTGSVNTTVTLFTATALTTAGGTLTTGFKSFDSGWVSFASLGTNISAYGVTVLRPRYQLDRLTADPTVFHLTASYFVRVA